MPTVYRVTCDVNSFKKIVPDVTEDSLKYRFDGTPFRDTWQPINTYIFRPTLSTPDFWGTYTHVFAVAQVVPWEIEDFFSQACEMLPVLVEEHAPLRICNVTNVVNCLDKRHSKVHPDIPKVYEYAFRPERMAFSLFKIPETRTAEILCVEGVSDPESEFKGVVELLGLTGLRFKKLWSDET